jgi:alpha-ketoglutarate-dependent taurine dioxygenase
VSDATITPLTEIVAQARCGHDEGDVYRDKLAEHGLVVIDPPPTGDLDIDALMAGLGNVVEYQFGSKLTIKPEPDAGNSQLSNRGMPLHVDGVLNAGDPVRFIGLQCQVAPTQGGETIIANGEAFFALAPQDLLDTLRSVEIQYHSRVANYYKDGREEVSARVAPIKVDPVTGEETLHLALDDPEDEKRNYRASVAGWDAEESAELLERVDAVLRRPEVFYAHQWKVGELLILDNGRMLHGRAAFPEDVQRKLLRLSTTA